MEKIQEKWSAVLSDISQGGANAERLQQELNDEVAAVNAAHNKAIAELNAQIETLNTKVSGLESDSGTTVGLLEQANATIADLNAQLEASKKSVSLVEAELTDTSKQLKESKEANKSMSAEHEQIIVEMKAAADADSVKSDSPESLWNKIKNKEAKA